MICRLMICRCCAVQWPWCAQAQARGSWSTSACLDRVCGAMACTSRLRQRPPKQPRQLYATRTALAPHSEPIDARTVRPCTCWATRSGGTLRSVAHTLTWVVRPTVMFCMVLNILTQYPLHAPASPSQRWHRSPFFNDGIAPPFSKWL